MKNLLIAIMVCLSGLFTGAAMAEDAALKIDGDLMVHPDQMGNFFALAANKIKGSPSWDWPSLTFTKPYHSAWSNVQAHGPFDIQFDTTNLKSQEFGFTLNWASPQVSVGDFEIHDTLVRDVGGAHLVIHLDGACQNMLLNVPAGAWTVKGHMHWDLTTQAFVVTWTDFQFSMNSAVTPLVDSGQCQGAPGLIKDLHDAIVTMAKDQSWLGDVLKPAVLEFVQNSMGSLQSELLKARDAKLNDRVTLSWQPSTLTMLSGGLLRVGGKFALSKTGATLGAESLPRGYEDSVVAGVKESGFILPKNSLQHILNYMFTNGELTYRLESSKMASFQSLMNSTFEQFFVWPDLMSFNSSTLFYFDVTTEASPALQSGYMMDDGGSQYSFTAPVIAHQWAPGATKYLPYVDFRTPVQGLLTATIASGNLTLTTTTGDLNVSAQFRPEFAKTRSENTWIATSMLGSDVKSYLNTTPMVIPVPSWQLGDNLYLGPRDIQAWTKTFRIPLDFKTAK